LSGSKSLQGQFGIHQIHIWWSVAASISNTDNRKAVNPREMAIQKMTHAQVARAQKVASVTGGHPQEAQLKPGMASSSLKDQGTVELSGGRL
jgi:hypothetical protein